MRSEISSRNPNSYVLSAALGSLTGMVDQSVSKELEQLLSLFNEKITANWKPHVESLFKEVISKSRIQEKVELASLKAVNGPEGEGDSLDEQLMHAVDQGSLSREAGGVFRAGTGRFLSDELMAWERKGTHPEITGREREVQRVLEVLVRLKARVPVLVGRAGVGKTAIAETLALRIAERRLRDNIVLDREFPKGSVVIQTTPGKISELARSNDPTSQAVAVENYIRSIKEVEKALGVTIVLFVDEFHTFSRAQLNALKPLVEDVDGVRIVGASTPGEFELSLDNDNAWRRRVEAVNVSEMSEEQTLEVIKEGWLDVLEQRYFVKFTGDELVDVLRLAQEVYPDLARPSAQIKFLDALAAYTSTREEKTNQEIEIGVEAAKEYASILTGIPINPRKPQELMPYIEKGRSELKRRVVGQDHLVDALVNLWQQVMTGEPGKAAKSAVIIGTTGVGKTLIAKQLGEVFLGSREKVLTIDATAFQTGDLSLNSLIGAPPGVISSDKRKGVLPEWLSGPGKQAGIIIINEFDKAHPDFAKRLMEMLDQKTLTAGDGREYRLSRHLIVFTTNRGANRVFDPKLGKFLSTEEMSRRVENITPSQAKSFFTESEGYASRDAGRLPPEVVNRIDAWMVAKPLTFEDAVKIAEIEITQLTESLLEQHGFKVAFSQDLIRRIVEQSFTRTEGVRDVKQALERTFNEVLGAIWKHVENVERSEFAVEIHDEREKSLLRVIDKKQDDPVVVEVPYHTPPKFMAIQDPRFMEILSHLGERLRGEIYGQDEAIETIVRAVRRRAAMPGSRPLSIGLFGLTGTGKTEIAKSLAKYLYGGVERARILSFGKIQEKFDLANIFNPPKGVQGSDEISEFERILQSFGEEGGVIVFDELSNMGKGRHPHERSALFMQLYEIFEEGEWTSPLGKTYDLSKFTIISTGNDGEHLFRQQPNEDLKLAVWEQMHSRDRIVQILLDSHIPEAFINRMDALVLMRPTGSHVQGEIVRKFMRAVQTEFEREYNISIIFADDLIEKISQAFFPIQEGARAARRFVEEEVSGLVAELIMAHQSDIAKAEDRIELHVTLELDAPEKPWAVERVEAAKGILRVEAKLDRGVVREEREVRPISLPNQVSREDARRTAIHEAGHALVNERLGQPRGRLEWITIAQAGDAGGYARFKGHESGVHTRQGVLNELAVMAGGMMAQELRGMERDSGWQRDLQQMRALAQKAILQYGLSSELDALPNLGHEEGLSQLSADQRERVNTEIEKLMTEAKELARQVLSAEGTEQFLNDLVERLLQEGSLKGGTVSELLADEKVESKEKAVTEQQSPFPPEHNDESPAGTKESRSEQFLSPADLSDAIERNRHRVAEFEFLAEEAGKLGVRLWLFGGTAAGFAHYVYWDLMRERGVESLPEERFDYDFTNIYRSTQDADLAIDGIPEQADQLERSVREKFPHLQGNKSVWEIRTLRKKNGGNRIPILGREAFDFQNQHTDSNSTGLIELTQSTEPVVRDARDWSAEESNFLRDVATRTLHYYDSKKHEETSRAREGKNPPIVSVIRYLTKIFQFELKIPQESLKNLKKVIEAFDPAELKNDYVRHWMEKNAKKLILNAVDVEYAIETLGELGLREKLIALGDKNEPHTMAWWLNREPLAGKPLGQGEGKTMNDLVREGEIQPDPDRGKVVAAHETFSFLAYETMTHHPAGKPNALISRQGIPGEAAAYGDGFYTRIGSSGARGTGLTVRYEVEGRAREGVDFERNGDFLIFRNKNALKVIPEILTMTPGEYADLITNPQFSAEGSDLAVYLRLKRRIFNQLSASSQDQRQAWFKRLKKANLTFSKQRFEFIVALGSDSIKEYIAVAQAGDRVAGIEYVFGEGVEDAQSALIEQFAGEEVDAETELALTKRLYRIGTEGVVKLARSTNVQAYVAAYLNVANSEMAIGRTLSLCLHSGAEEYRAFGEDLLARLENSDWKDAPVVAAYLDIARIGQQRSAPFPEAAKEWLTRADVIPEIKAQFLLSNLGVEVSGDSQPNPSSHSSPLPFVGEGNISSPLEGEDKGEGAPLYVRYRDSMPQAERDAVLKVIDEKTNLFLFEKLAKEQGEQLLRRFYEVAKAESFLYIPFEFPKKGKQFRMGKGDGAHDVVLTRSFGMQATPFTQLQVALLLGENPSRFKDTGAIWIINSKEMKIDANRPTESISHNDIQERIMVKLNEIDPRYQWRLPMEAEWEYAARGGTDTAYSFGDDSTKLFQYGWFSENSDGKTQEVARLKPNAFGLFDMYGLVWEWCQDWYGDYPKEKVVDPQGPKTGSYRVFRGGGWHSAPGLLRSAARNYYGPAIRHGGVGLRVVRT
ncbi:MAG: SUMF1/EgtB/PvdO family nonheme iron enzyme, partial [Deltaproteobacteria bacterium]|nr:SUMF1/EgtB/PvdO family nonheme iron enzyme [Deltaproteobacteria bacterium]